MRSSLFAIYLLLTATAAIAQPYKFGCHYFRQHPSAAVSYSDADRELINDIIARSDTFDIRHYDIAIDVTDYAGQILKAATTISYAALMPGQSFIRFELWGLTVDSVSSPEGTLSFSNNGTTLRVNFASVPAVGDEHALTVHYHGTPHRDPDWGGFYFESNYIYNFGIGLTTVPPNFGKVWYPCFDSFVERATYTYHVKSAGTFRAHCQGDFLGEVQLAGDTVVRSFDFPYQIPTHLSAIAAADYQDTDYVHVGAYGDVPVRLTSKTAQLPAMEASFADLGSAIDACEFWYGPYPYGRVGYAMTTDGALEIPENVGYPDFMTTQSLHENRGLFGHELGHHWWGDMITPYTHHDMWLKEGPAEYSAHLLEEWVGGEDAFVDAVKDNQLYVLEQANIQDGGFLALSPMPDAEIYGLHTYNKGAAVMHNLRGYLGDTLFRQALHGVQQHHALSTITSAQFRDELEAESGYDLHPFFDAWVFAPGFSTFVVDDVNAQGAGSSWSVDVNIRQKLRGTSVLHHQVPLDITLVGAGGERQEYTEMVDGEFTQVTLPCAFDPAMVVLNGHNRLNQARMDYEFKIAPDVAFDPILPRVAFRAYPIDVQDTVLFRVDHIWSGPDADNLGFGIDELSTTHYWKVDGLWPEGTHLKGELFYKGQNDTQLDYDLFNGDETGAMLVYRATPHDPWEICPDLTITTGSLTNGTGVIDINTLQKGEYAFAKGTGVAGIQEASRSADVNLRLWPVPTGDVLTVSGSNAPATTAWFDVRGIDGRLVMRNSRSIAGDFEKRIDVSPLPAGSYILQVTGVNGITFGTAKFEVRR